MMIKTHYSTEITQLKAKNDELFKKIKKLSKELDVKITHHSMAKHEEVKPQLAERKIASEIDCMGSMNIVYEKEVKQLKAKLNLMAGYRAVVQIQKKVSETCQQQGQMRSQIKELLTGIKGKAKELQKADRDKEMGAAQMEVGSILNHVGRSIFEKY